jgi:hypothetical protein
MKPLTPTFAIVCLLAFTYATGQAPPDYSALCKEKMKKIAALAGQWEGEASVSTGPAPAMVITQKEDVQFKIDRTVLVIEGTGTRDGSVVFNAYAVINFNVRSQAYELRSYLKMATQLMPISSSLERTNLSGDLKSQAMPAECDIPLLLMIQETPGGRSANFRATP